MSPMRRNEITAMSRSIPWSWRGVYDGSNNLTYEGEADPGSDEDNPVWKIAKYTYDGSNNLTKIEWAKDSDNRVADFTNIWTNYADLNYV